MIANIARKFPKIFSSVMLLFSSSYETESGSYLKSFITHPSHKAPVTWGPASNHTYSILKYASPLNLFFFYSTNPMTNAQSVQCSCSIFYVFPFVCVCVCKGTNPFGFACLNIECCSFYVLCCNIRWLDRFI